MSLSLSRGHLRIKLYPYHFQVIMMHELSKMTHFSPGRFLQSEVSLSFPLSLPSRTFPFLLHLGFLCTTDSIDKGHSGGKQWFGFTLCSNRYPVTLHKTKGWFVKLFMLFAKWYQISVKVKDDFWESANIYSVSTFAWNSPGVLHISGIIWQSQYNCL